MARDYGPRPFLGRDWYKAHALGNDYLVFEEAGGWRAAPAAVARVCHRYEGVGGDGMVVLLELPRGRAATGYPLRMFNPDGSEFERSGNGLRVLAAYLHRRGRVGDGPFEVSSGGESMRVQVHSHTAAGSYDVEVEMGRARIGPDAVGLDARALDPDGRLAHPLTGPVALVPLGIGNPHAVLFADALAVELAPATLERLGPAVATHPALAHGANVQLAQVSPPAALDILIWERGVGPTTASGTSACATAAAAVATGRLEPGKIEVRMPGGSVRVQVSRELDVVLRGPVQEVGTGRLGEGFTRTLAAVQGES